MAKKIGGGGIPGARVTKPKANIKGSKTTGSKPKGPLDMSQRLPKRGTTRGGSKTPPPSPRT